MTTNDAVYAYGPLERRRFLLGMSRAQVATVVAGLVLSVMVMSAGSGGSGVVLALSVLAGAGLFAFVPVGSRSLGEWAPVGGRYVWRAASGAVSWRSPHPLAGQVGEYPADLPPGLEGVAVFSVDRGGAQVGMLLDGHTPVGVLRIHGATFALRDQDSQDALVAAWGDLLASQAEQGSLVDRVAWVDQSGAEDSGVLAAYAGRHGSPVTEEAAASYAALVDGAEVTQKRETFVVFRFDLSRAAAQVREAGGGDLARVQVAAGELDVLASQLRDAGFSVGGLPAPRELGRVVRQAGDPLERVWEQFRHAEGLDAGVDPASVWPVAAEEGWSAHRTDSAWHRTFWAEQLPRRPQRADWLLPLLAWTPDGGAARTVVAVFAPVDGLRALQEVERAAVSDEADSGLRGRWGIRTTKRRSRESELVDRREEELADGSADTRLAVYVTVSAASERELGRAGAGVVRAANRSRLRLRPLFGEQAVAWTYTLPLGRGLS